MVDPLAPVVVSFSTVHGGRTYNIIPDTVEATGTFRCYDADLREALLGSFKRTAEGVATALRCKAEVRNEFLTPAVINDPALAATARGDFEADLKQAVRIGLEDWKKRPMFQKLKERFSYCLLARADILFSRSEFGKRMR